MKDEEHAEGRVTCEKMGRAAALRDLVYFNDGKQSEEKVTEFQRYVEW